MNFKRPLLYFLTGLLGVVILAKCTVAHANNYPNPRWELVATVKGLTFYDARNLAQRKMFEGRLVGRIPMKLVAESGDFAYEEFFVDCTTSEWLVKSRDNTTIAKGIHPKASTIANFLSIVVCNGDVM